MPFAGPQPICSEFFFAEAVPLTGVGVTILINYVISSGARNLICPVKFVLYALFKQWARFKSDRFKSFAFLRIAMGIFGQTLSPI